MNEAQEEQKRLLAQVLALTEGQILALPNTQRIQILALREQLKNANV